MLHLKEEYTLNKFIIKLTPLARVEKATTMGAEYKTNALVS